MTIWEHVLSKLGASASAISRGFGPIYKIAGLPASAPRASVHICDSLIAPTSKFTASRTIPLCMASISAKFIQQLSPDVAVVGLTVIVYVFLFLQRRYRSSLKLAEACLVETETGGRVLASATTEEPRGEPCPLLQESGLCK